jgi:DNA-nicking Smr family endonuclease
LKKKISNKDKKDWENFILNKEKLPNKDFSLENNNKKIIKSIDLHGYTLEKANNVINMFIKKCFNENVSKIIVITGKGLRSSSSLNPYVSKDLSILKYSIPEFIESNQELMKMIIEITDAKIEDGGSGAFYIYLKNKLKNKL